MKKQAALILFFSVFLLQACTVGLGPVKLEAPQEYMFVYAPAAIDTTIYAGQSSRISTAIRNKLSQGTNLHWTSIENARWALEVNLTERRQKLNTADDCKNPGTPNVASGAFSCAIIHPELLNPLDPNMKSFVQPSTSPNTELMSLVVLVRAIDLDNGRVLWAKKYDEKNITPIILNEIGDPGDGRTIANLQTAPGLHALRYQEAIDRSLEDLANSIALDIKDQVSNHFKNESVN